MSFLNKNLTKAHGLEVSESHRLSVIGMAHFALTGPPGTTCRECIFWGLSRSYRRGVGGELRPRRCLQYPRLAGGNRGAGVPHATPSCKHFQAVEKPPAAILEKEEKHDNPDA